MKIFIRSLCCTAALSACAATPPTPLTGKDLEYAVYWQKVAQICIQRGQITYLPAMTNYIGVMGNAIATRATAEQTKMASQNVFKEYPISRVGLEACRYVEAEAVQMTQQQETQRQQQHARDQQSRELAASMDRLGASGRAMQQNALNSIPRTCTHYQWGNVTFC